MNKPLIYVDSDTAISCLRRSLFMAGFCDQAELLLGLTISSPDSARHARHVVAGLPKTSVTEEAQRMALEMLSFASRATTRTTFVQAPIDLC